jgi:hypothetical protein
MRKRKFNRRKQNFNGLKTVTPDFVFEGRFPRPGVRVVARVGMDQPYI